ncbi:MAG: helix-turn-helix transcriptional regulator [Rhizobiales bacterium]|nr:helix-turn-helix transcriptional regulator [Hyphomicrobiales bacterium]
MGEADGGGHELLTTKEIADFLRLKERKIYDLVSSDDIPHVRVSGKILFPRALIQTWLMRNTQYAGGVQQLHEPPLVMAGSHDPLLEWALAESGAGLPSLFDSSLDGIRRLQKGEAVAAGVHLREVTGYNREHVERELRDQPVVLIEWAMRTQGLLVAAGNPLSIRQVGDLQNRRVMLRQRSAGSFVLLEYVLGAAGLSLDNVDIAGQPAKSESELALAIANGRADAGLGLEAMARRHGLGFVPLAEERYDLVVWRRAWFRPEMQKLMRFAGTSAFRSRAEELGGYSLTGAGTVHYNGP